MEQGQKNNHNEYSNQRRNLNNYFVGTGVVRYLLSYLPEWANYSEIGKCRRIEHTRFFNLEKINKSYSSSYSESLQFQYMYNVKIRENHIRYGSSELPIKEEEQAFYQASDKVHSGIKQFLVPKYKRINLVWIDSALASLKSKQKIIRFLKSPILESAPIVLLSVCLGHSEFEKFIRNNKLGQHGIRFMPVDLFTPYSIDLKLTSNLQLNLSQFFDEDKKLYLYVRKNETTDSFTGNYQLKYY